MAPHDDHGRSSHAEAVSTTENTITLLELQNASTSHIVKDAAGGRTRAQQEKESGRHWVEYLSVYRWLATPFSHVSVGSSPSYL
jgi:hypothetical protein